MKIGGIVLCGGQSRRMGRAKAWLPFGDELMLQRIVRIVSEAVAPVVVVAAPEQDVPPLPGTVRIVRDAREGRGPLQGLAAGLAALDGVADAAYLSSCDVPFLRSAFVRRLSDLLESNAVCVPSVDGFHHAMAAIYRVSVLEPVLKLLNADRLRPVYLFESVTTRVVEANQLEDIDPGLQSLRNLNAPADYEAALRELQ